MRDRVQLAVLLPVRDGEKTLPACLESLEAQTFPDFRLIAVDDGSRDRTAEILHDTALRWSRSTARGRRRLSVVRLAGGIGIAPALALAAREALAPEPGDELPADLLARQD